MLWIVFAALVSLSGLIYDTSNEREIWTPSESGIIVYNDQHLQLIPEFDVYPVGVVAMRFTLMNNDRETHFYGVQKTLLKKIDEQWHVEPVRGNAGVSVPDIGVELSRDRHHDILFDIEAMYGLLDEGEYAVVKEIIGNGQRHYVFGQFTISADNYEIDAADTNIAPRPILYNILTSWDGVSQTSFLTFWTFQGTFAVWHEIEEGEAFDTTGMVHIDTWRLWQSPLR